MGTFEVEVIARTIKVRWKKKNGVETVLMPIAFRLDQHHFLCESIWRICFLRITVPKIILAERCRRKFWIGANCSRRDKLLYTVEPCLLNKLYTHHEVFVKKFPRVLLIRTYATHNSRKMYNEVRVHVRVESFDVSRLDQIVVGAARNEDLRISKRFEALNNKPSKEACSAGDDHAFVRKIVV